MKTSAERIRYYTRKVREYSAHRRSIPTRYQRLIAYKAALNHRIAIERRSAL